MSGEWCKMSGEWCVPFDFAAGATTRPPLNLHPTGTLPRVHPVLLQALRTAPETKSALQVQQALRLPGNLHDRQPRASGDHASTQSSCSSVYCACHEICTPGSPSAVPATKTTRQAAAGQRRPRVHPVLLQLRVLPLPRNLHALQVHQVLCLPRNLHDRQPRASGDHTSTQSSCRLCVLRPPRNLHFRFTKCCACGEISTPVSPSAVPARNLHDRRPRASGDHASTQSSCRLCVLRLPRNLHSRFTKCCACGEISIPGSPSAVPATKSTRQAAAGQRRPHVHPVLLQALYCDRQSDVR